MPELARADRVLAEEAGRTPGRAFDATRPVVGGRGHRVLRQARRDLHSDAHAGDGLRGI